jgi:hypothetical protein
MRLALRLAAVACLVTAAPAALVKYAWFPAFARSHLALRQESPSMGTEAYQRDRERRLSRGRHALTLYALAAFSLAWFVGVSGGAGPSALGAGAWLVAAGTGIAVARFESTSIGPTTDPAYVLMTFHTPLAIAAASVIAALATAWLSRKVSTPNMTPGGQG